MGLRPIYYLDLGLNKKRIVASNPSQQVIHITTYEVTELDLSSILRMAYMLDSDRSSRTGWRVTCSISFGFASVYIYITCTRSITQSIYKHKNKKMESALNTTTRIGSWSSVISPPLEVCRSFKWKLSTATRRVVVVVADRQNSNFRWWPNVL